MFNSLLSLRSQPTQLPRSLVVVILLICVAPLILNALGLNFGASPPLFRLSYLDGRSPVEQSNLLHQLLAGSFTHTILEWSAFCAALFTAILAFSHFNLSRDVTTPVIGITLLCAGVMDAFHTLAADRLITSSAAPDSLIPFTWALCRLCNVLLTMAGVGLFLLVNPKRWEGSSIFVLMISITFGLMAYSVIYVCTTQAVLPVTIFPDHFITRPWDVAPLVLFAIAGLLIYPHFYQRHPSLFSHALVISTIPNIATQLNMAFGSSALFDNAFNIAHFLKIIAYLVPLTGLLLDYSYTYQQVAVMNTHLRQEVSDRQQAQKALEESEQREREKSYTLEATVVKLQRTQAQLIQSEKMSSLGQMVAGIAHEINNPINFIYGNLAHATNYTDDLVDLIELYQAEYPQPTAKIEQRLHEMELDFLIEDLHKLIGSMRVGADRIRQIVISLRNFSRLDESERKIVDLQDGLESTLMLLHNQLKAKLNCPAIQILKEYEDLPLVDCYPGQLNQVFMNILVNSIQILREHPEIEKPWIKIHTTVPREGWVKILIQDNGPGIPVELQSRIFDPFFTTKPVGQGTGLGLAISYQIVHDHHQGKLTCEAIAGAGASFSVLLPTRLQTPPGPASESSAGSPAPMTW